MQFNNIWYNNKYIKSRASYQMWMVHLWCKYGSNSYLRYMLYLKFTLGSSCFQLGSNWKRRKGIVTVNDYEGPLWMHRWKILWTKIWARGIRQECQDSTHKSDHGTPMEKQKPKSLLLSRPKPRNTYLRVQCYRDYS